MYKLFLFCVLFFISCTHKESKKSNYKQKPIQEIKDGTVKDTIEDSLDLINQKNVTKKLSAYFNENKERKILMKTNYGNFKLKLYEGTPLHSGNFLMLTKRNYFDSTKFYRIFDKFMIQGGNSDDDGITLKMSQFGYYKIPNEINMNQYFHKRGALAMAVTHYEQLQGEKMSSAFNFYIVVGQKLPKSYLKNVEIDNHVKFNDSHIQTYTSIGGAAHLDGKYTVFGEVYEGMNVVEKISKVKTTGNDGWPIEPIYILSAEIIE